MITKAVIPAAGFGTRFLPATKASPKEMLPIVDTPVIQYVVEEAVASGITDILMVIGKGKRTLEEHFDRSFELELELEAKGKLKELASIRAISELANIHFVWQRKMLGLGDAIRCARHHVGDEPFAVLLGDTLMQSLDGVPATRQLMDVHDRFGGCVVALEEVPPERVSRYGVIDGDALDDRTYRVRDMVEKPAPADAPSNLVVASRYILTPDIFSFIDAAPPGKNGEIQITDALRARIADGRPMHGCRVRARRHDAGNTLDFIKTNILYALQHADIASALADFIIEKADELRGGERL
ncbi:MAG: UTP--glucose-1-phosphate uridylyltransferase GalU [Kiritimatiellia bacterium]|jgi:UTP--glucose-1-phosphate uridylyltransferase|nr:UTP--glucose-1-phosphate uridylyltransferase GalU [Kiritimatiellia bacterium]MDD4173027.1 UTP--glucose-1-phosphate uridylyltransferase GalU [Kiritimatiellia bacterium]MDD4441242.1 UTP--glucose-1-phosphate uridylyltransferase GalU [Kiritimatiellia bacterium]MDX9795152.1 UTP--glucose-1-phosphate uridylyltransferase GalU [Kiritimatiellia bacterium]NLC80625.1 UTP--glucose-1-phosphate uridylyltransferase GalU [Lentisphaerota bacterium]